MIFHLIVLPLIVQKRVNMKEKVIGLIRDIASGKDPYISADAKYMAFRKEYYTRFLAAIERGNTDAMLALDRICDNDSVDCVTETMNWLESWIRF